MSGKRLVMYPADVIYLYDGTMAGFWCCVYESVYTHELPTDIQLADDAEPTLFSVRTINTDAERARRVAASVPEKMGKRSVELLKTVYLSCMPQKEIAMLRYLLLGYAEGPKTPYMLGHPVVAPLLKAEKHLLGERHLLLGFVRFSDYGGMLCATITPKNFVLPLLAGHFVNRFYSENFLIYDKTHGAALIWQDRNQQLVTVENIEFPEADPEEEQYRALWRQFYKTIAIEARENPRCRMTHMPKRYWANMTEMQEFL